MNKWSQKKKLGLPLGEINVFIEDRTWSNHDEPNLRLSNGVWNQLLIYLSGWWLPSRDKGSVLLNVVNTKFI